MTLSKMALRNILQVKDLECHYSKTCLKRPLKKKTKIDFQDRLTLNAGQKYCRMLQREHSAILSTFIQLPFAINIFVLSIFDWPLKIGFTVLLDFSLAFLSVYDCPVASLVELKTWNQIWLV